MHDPPHAQALAAALPPAHSPSHPCSSQATNHPLPTACRHPHRRVLHARPIPPRFPVPAACRSLPSARRSIPLPPQPLRPADRFPYAAQTALPVTRPPPTARLSHVTHRQPAAQLPRALHATDDTRYGHGVNGVGVVHWCGRPAMPSAVEGSRTSCATFTLLQPPRHKDQRPTTCRSLPATCQLQAA
ncbi:hypothetical protein GGX14DRAFT_572008 [Mycena pura]|uniref:Uncharacterized protein n=1 Tax=Mycena pura TaxID=153505 RepID=A0AAD6V1R7_9AGAR|nr:hypothetical protein GGX14DRAFT_572008 [Mycena pura]